MYIELTDVNCSHEMLCLCLPRVRDMNGLFAAYVHEIDCNYIALNRNTYLSMKEFLLWRSGRLGCATE